MTQQDDPSPADSSAKAKYISLHKLSWVTAFVAFFLFAFFPAREGYAFFADFLFKSAGAEEIDTMSSSTNLQNLDALDANLPPKPDDLPKDDPTTIVASTALLAHVGPLGTDADVSEIDNTPGPDQLSLYTVRSGDTITSIAKMFGVAENTIRWENNLEKGKALKVGTELLILPIDGIRHTVVKGETLASIAKKYKGDVDEIALYNDIVDNKVVVGEELIIPGGEIVATPKPSTSSSSSSSSSSSGKSASSRGYIRPLNGVITQYSHDRDGAYDIAKAKGSPVVAAASGTVIFAQPGWNGGYGWLIKIQHSGGITTLYAHLSEIDVKTGQTVSQGQMIGRVGSTGHSTGPHLHFATLGDKSLVKSIYSGAPSVARKK